MKFLKIIGSLILIAYASYRITNLIVEKVSTLNETEQQTIVREIIEQELEADTTLKDWKIINNEVDSENTFNNMLDSEKAQGEMRSVWITGKVEITYSNDLSTVENYSIELYQMIDGDGKWYIGNRYGFLVGLEVTETPPLSGNETYSDDETLDGQAPEDKVSKVYDEAQVNEEELDRWYMELMNLKFNDTQLLNYIDGGEVYAANIEVNKIEGQTNNHYAYILEGNLTSKFNTLTVNEQYDLLNSIGTPISVYDYYMGQAFDTEKVQLINGSDIYTITLYDIKKNDEPFIPTSVTPF